MVEKILKINNKAGIHCRPSSVIINLTEQYPGNEFLLESRRGTSSLSSILDLLALGLQCYDTVTLKVTGPDEVEAAGKLAEAIEHEYDFR